MSTVVLAFVAVILCIFFRILNVNSVPLKPTVSGNASFADTIRELVPLLSEPYIPTRLWGFSGHVQTIIHSAVGRLKCPLPSGHRTSLVLSDGSTLTYDTYAPIDNGELNDDVTIAVCPGIGNTSENVYIRTFVHYAQCNGYRIAVLNHIGALKSVKLTAPRIFSYGYTDDYHEMLCDVVKRYPETKIVALGYSLGGNLVAKYLGEHRKRHENIAAAISICQGYSALEGTKFLLNWQNFRRVYLYVLTEAVRNIILKHRYILLNESTKRRLNLNERDVIAAGTLPELDEAFTRKIYGFNSVEEMYKWSSCSNYLPNIAVPMIFINAKDDPLIPEELWTPAKKFASTHDQALFISLAHGGHLGFYEGGLVFPNPISWLDRAVIALIGGLLKAPKQLKP